MHSDGREVWWHNETMKGDLYSLYSPKHLTYRVTVTCFFPALGAAVYGADLFRNGLGIYRYFGLGGFIGIARYG